MADESIKIDIDVNASGADKAAQSIGALEKQIGSLQSAVATLKSPSGRGGTFLILCSLIARRSRTEGICYGSAVCGPMRLAR